MRILAIETSCDETAMAILEISGDTSNPKFQVLASTISSQAKLHAPFGGVFPVLAKREHIKNLPLVLEKVLGDVKTETIEAIAVTIGPGLEPALWTGIVFAKELAEKWSSAGSDSSENIPVIPVNHMEGHILSALVPKELTGDSLEQELFKPLNFKLSPLTYPAIALLVSGGHTELILVKNIGEYEIIGETRDDAAGECFDKVGRLLGLEYPAGPRISLLAERARMVADKNSTDNHGLLHEELTYKIRGACFAIANALGSGHKESVYQNALEQEFIKQNIAFEREKYIPVIYKEKKVGAYQPDFLVEGKIILELKAIPFLGNNEKKQLGFYLKNSPYDLGLLINFGGAKVEIERVIETHIRDNPSSHPRQSVSLPRPMLHSKDFDFSFSGLKTAVLYYLRDLGHAPDEHEVRDIARETEDAIVEVLVSKTLRAAEVHGAQDLLVGGGVSANKRLRETLAKACEEKGIALHMSPFSLTGDNAIMIALAGYFQFSRTKKSAELDTLVANGTLRL